MGRTVEVLGSGEGIWFGRNEGGAGYGFIFRYLGTLIVLCPALRRVIVLVY